jgi:hypothetical protein
VGRPQPYEPVLAGQSPQIYVCEGRKLLMSQDCQPALSVSRVCAPSTPTSLRRLHASPRRAASTSTSPSSCARSRGINRCAVIDLLVHNLRRACQRARSGRRRIRGCVECTNGCGTRGTAGSNHADSVGRRAVLPRPAIRRTAVDRGSAWRGETQYEHSATRSSLPRAPVAPDPCRRHLRRTHTYWRPGWWPAMSVEAARLQPLVAPPNVAAADDAASATVTPHLQDAAVSTWLGSAAILALQPVKERVKLR